MNLSSAVCGRASMRRDVEVYHGVVVAAGIVVRSGDIKVIETQLAAFAPMALARHRMTGEHEVAAKCRAVERLREVLAL